MVRAARARGEGRASVAPLPRRSRRPPRPGRAAPRDHAGTGCTRRARARFGGGGPAGARRVNWGLVAAWALYDFANSSFAAVIFATIYAAYYALGVVGNDRGAGDLWWGRVVSVSMAIVAVTSPFLGGIADRAGVRRRLFIGFTVLS